MAHTPGPWEYLDATKIPGMQYAPKCVIKSGSLLIADFSWNDHSPFFPTKDESQANARLIAAAPELLEALQALAEKCEYSHLRQLAYGVIARATGDTPR